MQNLLQSMYGVHAAMSMSQTPVIYIYQGTVACKM